MPKIGETALSKDIGFKGTTRRIWVACPDCGKERWVHLVRGIPKNTLCHTCSSRKHILKLHTRLSGEKHPQWKGGRIESKRGYVSILKPSYHRASKAGYVSEHIYTWETTHNKILPNGWIIHHINGVKNDNRPRNLLAMPRGKHHGWVVMQAQQQRIRELEQEVNLLERALNSNQLIFRLEEN